MYRDPVKREMVPCLAESYTFLDAMTIEMKLRKEVLRSHNGEPFNAEAVRYSMEILKDPKMLNYGYLKVLKTSRSWTSTPSAWSGSAQPDRARDDRQHVLQLPAEYYKKVGREGFGKSPVGTGPYQFVSWKQDTEVVFKAYPNYFGGPKGKARIPNLLIRIIPEEVTRVAELMTGGVDLIRGGLVSPEQIP